MDDKMAEGRMLKRNISKKRTTISKSLKLKVLAKFDGFCLLCGKEGFVDLESARAYEKEPYKHWISVYDGTFNWAHLPMEFDHIIPLKKGGKTNIDNLQIVCRKCNRSKCARMSDKCTA